MNLNNSSFENNPDDSKMLTGTAIRRLLTASEAALYLGITGNKLANLRHSALGPDWVQLGRTIRYIPDDLDWWLKQSDWAVSVATSGHSYWPPMGRN